MRYDSQQQRIVWSASDLKAAAECEFAWVRAIDAKLGRIEAVPDPVDETRERASQLGTAYEARVLDAYRAEFGDAVIEIAHTRSSDADRLAEAVAATRAALANPDAQIIFQAAFATDDFVGFADFLRRDEHGLWVVQDTKLARHARVTALMQLAAYADQLDQWGIARSDRVELLLGDGTVSAHDANDLLPVFALRRARLRALITDRQVGHDVAPIAWGDPRGDLAVVADGRCPTCELEVIAHRDLLLVAGMRPVQRERLRAAGITTIDDLAAATEAPARMNTDVFDMLRTQARLQLISPAGVPTPDDATDSADTAVPAFEVVFPPALGSLPRPDDGDIFFDFEGDPLYSESDDSRWGIDYLFGWVDMTEQYSALWAHTFEREKEALEKFLDVVAAIRRQHPDMHIYHYAPYETAHLQNMAARYGVREAEVDTLLREGVFVDLYPVVRRAVRVGSRSYSIKKLEPLYMGDDVRTSDVQQGGDSIVRYVEARLLEESGRHANAQEILDDLADYNRYDCVSTLRLRDWLVERARENQLLPAGPVEADAHHYEPSVQATTLLDLSAATESPADAEALRLASAAIDYYPREAKSYWSMHFLRLREPLTLWADTRDVLAVDPDRSAVGGDWEFPEGRGAQRRHLALRGDLAPGTRLKAGARVFAIYEAPAPFPSPASSPRNVYDAREVTVTEELDDGAIITETAVDGLTWDTLPVALTPGAPPPAGRQQSAIERWADTLISAQPNFPTDPATDILRRQPPRTRSGGLATGDTIDAIISSVTELDHSYLAVQGPPGTGKTHVGARVIRRLVSEHGYRVGIVAQSHAVVENMLDRVVGVGLDPTRVAKALSDDRDVAFTPIERKNMAGYLDEHADGCVIGGTAWDFSNADRVPPGSLDLLVIEEAGQFSLASTIAVAVSTSRVLLLGDPQQLPQVSQGTHPAPVDTSALGWIMEDRAVIPDSFGYFLDRTWRMDPAVAGPVSRLSYAGRLASQLRGGQRSLAGISPGVKPVPLAHRGNATSSPEEAAAVVDIVTDLVGREWTGTRSDDSGQLVPDAPRPLAPSDIIVVTPYNAQQVEVEAALTARGFGDIPVGTVDKFQGKEAVISIVSLAASSGRDAPRGLEFLLLQNRLNVAVSRAQCAAYLVYSPWLLDDLPRTPEGVTRLSAFARLVMPELTSQPAASLNA